MFQTLAYYATAFHRSFVNYTTAKLQTLGLNFGSCFWSSMWENIPAAPRHN